MKAPFLTFLAFTFFLFINASDNKELERVKDANTVLTDIGKIEETIPKDLMASSEGVMVFPKLINAGFVVGGKRGKGVALVRNANGKWSDPVFVMLTGGSFGLQIGVQAIDLILIFKHRTTLQKIGKGDFTLGGDASAAAGPVGRNSSASTNYKLDAEIYSYSRSRGLFAGLSLQGSALTVDAKANNLFYGNETDAMKIFEGTPVSTTPEVAALKKTLAGL